MNYLVPTYGPQAPTRGTGQISAYQNNRGVITARIGTSRVSSVQFLSLIEILLLTGIITDENQWKVRVTKRVGDQTFFIFTRR